MFETVHHTAFIVGDMDAAIALFTERFGIEVERRFVSGSTEYALMPSGTFILELLGPAAADSPHHKTLRERGDVIMDHVGYGVHNLEKVLDELQSRGVRLRADGVKVAATGWRVVSLDPDSTGGFRLQLVDLDH